jgi:hypothetical protein
MLPDVAAYWPEVTGLMAHLPQAMDGSMKNRMNIVVIACLVIIGVLMWTIIHDRSAPIPAAPTLAASNGAANTLTIRVQTTSTPAPTSAAPTSPLVGRGQTAQAPVTPPAALSPAQPVAPIIANTPSASSAVRDDMLTNGRLETKSQYTAHSGDTVSNLAAELPGGDKKINRDAVINANPSLQQNPDRVLEGKTYQIPASADAPAPVIAPVAAAAAVTPAVVAPAESDEVVHQLKYIARPGDSVSTLAAALLGSDTKENRDAIINANASLQANPDRVIDGQTYRIPVRASQPLAAAPASLQQTLPRPTTQPDADGVVQAGSARELRYKAQPGDNVSTLATALLGSDTAENRAAIINNNEVLKKDPDRVVAGQTYWIPAPVPAQP